MAYDKAALRIRGPRAYLNFPLETVAQAMGIDKLGKSLNNTSEIHQGNNYDGVIGCSIQSNNVNTRKRASREWEENDEVGMSLNDQPAMKRKESVNDIFEDEFGLIELEDLGNDYLETLLSSF